VPVLVGLVVAMSYGSGDFLGGLASKQARTLAVLTLVQLVAVAGAVVVALAAGGHATTTDLVMSAGSGLLNVVALGALYRALAIGQIGQVAPVAAVIGAVVPVVWGLATGERPSLLAVVGVVLAIVAGGLVSIERESERGHWTTRALPLAVAAGVGFGSSFILFAETSHGSGFWPVLAARGAALCGVVIVARLVRTPFAMPRASRLQSLAAGGLDVLASTALLVAVRAGLIATVAPVVSLTPGFTVAHAWWYLHQRATRLQLVGLVVGLIGLVMIAAG
jgi:drug/metabolite transporter (DMT)-like permease